MRRRPKITEFKFDQYIRDLRTFIQESVSPFENDSPEKQKARVDRARWDKLYFMREYLPHYFSSPFGDFHEEWADLADLEEEVVLVAAPREHAKSTFFTFGDDLHKICFGLRHFIIILSDTNDQASTFTVGIGLELEENPRLKHDFGKLLGPVWNKSSFITTNGIWSGCWPGDIRTKCGACATGSTGRTMWWWTTSKTTSMSVIPKTSRPASTCCKERSSARWARAIPS